MRAADRPARKLGAIGEPSAQSSPTQWQPRGALRGSEAIEASHYHLFGIAGDPWRA